MKALFLIQGHNVPSSRYRVLQFLPFWRAAGHEDHTIEFNEIANIDSLKEIASEYDIIFFHRKRLSYFKLKQLKKLSKRLVYDVDDAVMFRDALKPGRSKSFLRALKYHLMVSQMDQVIAGNSYIVQNTSTHLKSSIDILPTCINTNHIPKDIATEPNQPILVWIGDSGSIHYLEKLTPVLEKIGQIIPGCSLKIICNRFFELNNMNVIKVTWSQENEIKELQNSQIGLMPLGTDPWSKGKCSLKFLQYLSVGRPAVVTPVGMNADLLNKSPCGFGALTEDQWIKHIVSLLKDKELRIKMGQNGFDLVHSKYSLKVNSQKWIELVSGISTEKT